MKLVAVAAFAAAVLAIGGVGFAWGGGGCHDHHGGDCRERPALSWVAPTSTSANGVGVHCTASATPSLLTAAGTGFFPGARCWLNATIENTGQQLDKLVPHISASVPPGCATFTYSDNLLGVTPQVQLAPGHTYAYHAQFSLGLTAGNSCERQSAHFQVTISTSGTEDCDGFIHGSTHIGEGRCD